MSGSWECFLHLVFLSSIPAYEYWMFWLVYEWFINTSIPRVKLGKRLLSWILSNHCLACDRTKLKVHGGISNEVQLLQVPWKVLFWLLLLLLCMANGNFCALKYHIRRSYAAGLWTCSPPQRALQSGTTRGAGLLMHFYCDVVVSHLWLNNLTHYFQKKVEVPQEMLRARSPLG